ncbi:hypothetical protein [Enterococcus phage EFLK1]|uniref:Uncharacterized protein n=4 Tax=Kochikohdavirus TaxID=2560160 RepID=A0A0E3TA72_9CAUD|nr:hypothetical protein [Enterococcus phage ECP3]YP_009219806.1 hypothetical protein AVT53_gp104 [Enterococcus phage EFLK1]QPW37267.1 hypothetical protein [Enterococcus phage PBEF129]CAI9187597.1 hypothetical protein [Enterococcus phage Sw5]AII28381.1 hypothetical protein [Enterococcus phage ECP3]AKC05075.1 hypothetical protein [Enterococcus phage EFLK1]
MILFIFSIITMLSMFLLYLFGMASVALIELGLLIGSQNDITKGAHSLLFTGVALTVVTEITKQCLLLF